MRRREQYSMFATLAGSKLSLGTDHLTCRWGGYGLLFRSELEFFLSHEARIFFPEYSIRLYDKNSESYFLFSSTKIRIFFSATMGIRVFFLEKKP